MEKTKARKGTYGIFNVIVRNTIFIILMWPTPSNTIGQANLIHGWKSLFSMSYQASVFIRWWMNHFVNPTYYLPLQPQPVGKDIIREWVCLKEGTPAYCWCLKRWGTCARQVLPPMLAETRGTGMRRSSSAQVKVPFNKSLLCSLLPSKGKVANIAIHLKGNYAPALLPHAHWRVLTDPPAPLENILKGAIETHYNEVLSLMSFDTSPKNQIRAFYLVILS